MEGGIRNPMFESLVLAKDTRTARTYQRLQTISSSTFPILRYARVFLSSRPKASGQVFISLTNPPLGSARTRWKICVDQKKINLEKENEERRLQVFPFFSSFIFLKRLIFCPPLLYLVVTSKWFRSRKSTETILDHERSGDRRLVSGFLCLELEVERKLPTASGDQTHKGNLTRLPPALTANLHFARMDWVFLFGRFVFLSFIRDQTEKTILSEAKPSLGQRLVPVGLSRLGMDFSNYSPPRKYSRHLLVAVFLGGERKIHQNPAHTNIGYGLCEPPAS